MLRMEYPKVQKVTGTMNEACDALKLMGYTHLDSGRFARVFAKDDHVVKIGLVNDDNYFNYIRMIGLRSKNPHLPHILSADVYDKNPDEPTSEPYYIVKMERLKVNFDMTPWRAAYWERHLGVDGPYCLDEKSIETVSPRTKAMIEVKNILTHLYKSFDAEYDVGNNGTANILWRGKTAVFTDPVI